MECLATHSTPSLEPNREPGCGVGHGLLFREGGPQMDGENYCGDSSKEMLNGKFGFENLGLQFNTIVHPFGSLSLVSSKYILIVGDCKRVLW